MKAYQKIKKYYDNYGEIYDYERNKTYYYDFINKIEIETLIPYIRNKVILEIGCGTGIILEETSKYTNEVYGIDLSEGMLKDAKRKGLKVINANATKSPFCNSKFDVVYSFKVLPHIPDLKIVIEEIHRILKPDGYAILEFYNPYSFKYLTNCMIGAKQKVFTRFDTFPEIKRITMKFFKISDIIGARIITPAAVIHKIPYLGYFIKKIEKRLSKTTLKKFSGYYIVLLKKI